MISDTGAADAGADKRGQPTGSADPFVCVTPCTLHYSLLHDQFVSGWWLEVLFIVHACPCYLG